MTRPAGLAIALLWAGWLLIWVLAAFAAKPVARRESIPSRLVHVVPLVIAATLLGARSLPGWLGARFVASSVTLDTLALALVALGLGFSVWARHALGGNWSGTVTLKHEHTIVRSGPYRVIRHPIYTGLLVAIVGTALARGEWRGAVALLLVAVALLRKIDLEERWLGEAFGPAYAEYRARSWALFPFLY